MGFPNPTFTRSNELQDRLHEMVPGGAHTYARGDDQYPEGMAPIIEHGLGARVWDADGNCFVEYGMGLRAVTLGHCYAPVVDAVREHLCRGVSFTRPSTLEVEAAEDFLSLVPGADMVKFAKNGSDATTAALKLSRAVTGRELVAVADQPFFSTDDWFIGATGMPGGIPDPVRAETVRFTFNDLESLRAAVAAHPGQIAAVFMEAATGLVDPAPGYLEAVRELCTAEGIVLVFDEMITGFRWAAGGAQEVVRRRPRPVHLGQGHGQRLLDRGARRAAGAHGARRPRHRRRARVPALDAPAAPSSSGWPPSARSSRPTAPPTRSARCGAPANGCAREANARDRRRRALRPPRRRRATRAAWCSGPATPTGLPSQEYRTLFLADLLRGGVLGQSFVVSAAHTDADVDLDGAGRRRRAARPTRKAIERGTTDGLLDGRPVAPALRAARHAAPPGAASTVTEPARAARHRRVTPSRPPR